jgi:DNA-binding MarR family transcriptional regulator
MKSIPAGPIPSVEELAALDLERYLPFRLSVLANRVTRAVARAYSRNFRLSAPEWRTMAVLGRYGAMTANSVVERTAMDKVRVSRAVARLLARGRVTRRTDPEDRRRAILDLTPEGRAVYAAVVPLVLAIERELLGDLSAEERGALDQILHKLERRTAADLGDEGDGDGAEY